MRTSGRWPARLHTAAIGRRFLSFIKNNLFLWLIRIEIFIKLRIRFEGYLISIILIILRNSHVLSYGLVFIIFLIVLIVVLLLDLIIFGVDILLFWLFYLINDIGTWSIRSLILILLSAGRIGGVF